MNVLNSFIVKRYIANRGLFSGNFPENSLGAFEECCQKNIPIELDIHLLEDGELAVFNDETLSRMTGKDGYIKRIKSSELKNYKLNNSEYYIPTLTEALNLIAGRVPVLIEVKEFSSHAEAVIIKLIEVLKGYKNNNIGDFEIAVQSFNPYALALLAEKAPYILRGQLSGYFKKEKLSFRHKFILKRMLLNKVSKPNFICYDFNYLPNRFVRRFPDLPLVAYTIKTEKDFYKTVKNCDNMIFENLDIQKLI